MQARIDVIGAKLDRNEPLSFEDGCYLFDEAELLQVGVLADRLRRRLNGQKVFYNRNLHLNSTNVCEADCLFCSFARLQEGMPQAYTMNLEQARRWIDERYHPAMTEIHIVNGLNPDLPFAYYEELLRMLRSNYPGLHIKAFTAVEIHYFSRKFGMSYEQVLGRLVEAGLGSLPGGGAEIFADRVRRKICRDKVDADGWLDVHRVAHRLGLRSNCTMLYGTIETTAERVEHLLRLRELQAETGGFQAFIPLAFHNEGNRMERLPPPTAIDDLRVVAVSRLLLNNVPHIKAYWIMLGVKTAHTALCFGADDLDGTVTEEKIYHMAGSHSPQALGVADIERLIRSAGFEPVERDTLYSPVIRSTRPLEGDGGPVARAAVLSGA